MADPAAFRELMLPSGMRVKRSMGHRQKELFKAAIVSCPPGSVPMECNKPGTWFMWLAAARMLLHKGTNHSIPERCRHFALGEWQQLWAEAREYEEGPPHCRRPMVTPCCQLLSVLSHAVNMLSTVLSTCCQRAVTCCQCAVNALSTYCQSCLWGPFRQHTWHADMHD
jgi:hypothetical protein